MDDNNTRFEKIETNTQDSIQQVKKNSRLGDVIALGFAVLVILAIPKTNAFNTNNTDNTAVADTVVVKNKPIPDTTRVESVVSPFDVVFENLFSSQR